MEALHSCAGFVFNYGKWLIMSAFVLYSLIVVYWRDIHDQRQYIEIFGQVYWDSIMPAFDAGTLPYISFLASFDSAVSEAHIDNQAI